MRKRLAILQCRMRMTCKFKNAIFFTIKFVKKKKKMFTKQQKRRHKNENICQHTFRKNRIANIIETEKSEKKN